MSIETIKCPVCGYSAQSISIGGKGKIQSDLVAMQKVCQNFAFNSSITGCKVFDDEIQRPRSAG